MADIEDEKQPWERQPGEGPRAFAMFQAFLALPAERRTVRAAWESVTGAKRHQTSTPPAISGHIKQWAAGHQWAARAAAWEAEETKRAQAELVVQRTAALKRHIDEGRAAQQMGLSTLRDAQAGNNPGIPAAVAARLLFDGAALERAALGEPERQVEVTLADGTPSEDRVARVRALMAVLRGKAPTATEDDA